MNDRMLTYRYPRTLAEACARHACDGEDARAIHGPYKTELNPDDVVVMVCAVMAVVVAVMAAVGWVQ